MLANNLPALQVVLPLFGAVLCAMFRRGILGWAVALMVSWAMPVIAVLILLKVSDTGVISYAMGGWAPPWGIEYRIDMLSAFMLMLISLIAAITMPYARRSVGYEIDGDKQSWFYAMYLLCLSGLLGIVVSGDAFNIFVFVEISSLSTYVLIALGKDRKALVAAFQYLIMGSVGATFYVIGIGLLYMVTGTLNLTDLAERLPQVESLRPVFVALAFITVGISLKLALFPLHVWLPNAYAFAPSMATVFLAATATKVAIYVLLRFFFSVFAATAVFKTQPFLEILLGLSIVAMFGASLVAIYQDNVKRMLAYSSVAQVGYITLGIALSNQAGLTGGIVHLMNHAVTKAALFMSLGAVFYRLGSVNISALAGIGRHMPITLGVFVVGGLSIIGIPGTAGFVSKWYLAIASFEQGLWILVFLLVLSSLISVVYIGRIVEVAWFRTPSVEVAALRDPPLSMLVPMIILAAATVYFGVHTTMTVDIASKAAEVLLGGGK